MIPHTFAYLTVSLISLIPWILFFILRKDLRKEMIGISVIWALVGLAPEYYVWTKDWWHPETITHTIIGIEDFILGFSNGGMAAVLFEEFFRRKSYKSSYKFHTLGLFLILTIAAITATIALHKLNMGSFLATVFGLLVIGVLILFQRRDLIIDALSSGIIAALGSLPFYLFVRFLFPGWIEKTWDFAHISGITFIGIPIEDVVFYFLIGFVAGPMYMYYTGRKLRKIASEKKYHKKINKRH